MGTGSTAVVSKKLKRNYIGSEISNEYMKVINERLSAVSETLF
jgi:DNA modification methylase